MVLFVVVIVWQLDLQLSVPITTKVLSLNPVHDKVYSIQLYAINFDSNLRQVGGFLWVLWFPPPIKLTTTIYNWNIVESAVKHHNPNPFRLHAPKETIYNWNIVESAIKHHNPNPFLLHAPKDLNYFVFQSFNWECT